MEGKICVQCNEFKPIMAFDVSFNGTSRKNRCKACYAVRDRVRTKLNFIAMYGGQCACCGISDPRFLTLDHIASDGGEHRKDLACNQIMALAIKKYEPSKYQVLCYNCNCGKSTNGGLCPHKDKSLEDYLAYTEILLASGKVDGRIRTTPEQQVKELFKKYGVVDVDKLLNDLKGP